MFEEVKRKYVAIKDVAILEIPMQTMYVIRLGNFLAHNNAKSDTINLNEVKMTAPQYGSIGICAALKWIK